MVSIMIMVMGWQLMVMIGSYEVGGMDYSYVALRKMRVLEGGECDPLTRNHVNGSIEFVPCDRVITRCHIVSYCLMSLSMLRSIIQ